MATTATNTGTGLNLSSEVEPTAMQPFVVSRVTPTMYLVVDTRTAKPTTNPDGNPATYPTRKLANDAANQRNAPYAIPTYWVVRTYYGVVTVGTRAQVDAYAQSQLRDYTDLPARREYVGYGERVIYPHTGPVYTLHNPATNQQITDPDGSGNVGVYTNLIGATGHAFKWLSRNPTGRVQIYSHEFGNQPQPVQTVNPLYPTAGYVIDSQPQYQPTDLPEFGSTDEYNGITTISQLATAYANATRQPVQVGQWRYNRTEIPDPSGDYASVAYWPEWYAYTRITPDPVPVTTPSGTYSLVWHNQLADSTVYDKSPIATYPDQQTATDAAKSLVANPPITGNHIWVIPDYQFPIPGHQYAYQIAVARVEPSPDQSGRVNRIFGDLADTLHNIRWSNKPYAGLAAALCDTTPVHADLRLDPDGSLSWYPANRVIVRTTELGAGPRDLTNVPGRQSGKLVKSLRKCFPTLATQYSNSDWEQLGNHINAATTIDYSRFVVVRGDEIAYHYSTDGTAEDTDLGSCMTQDLWTCERYLAIYTHNPDQIGLIVYTDPDGLTLARALLWTLPDGSTALDRVYGPDRLIPAFERYATDNHNMTTHVWSGSGWGNQRDTGIAIHCTGQVQHDEYPSMDSLPYVNVTTGIVASNLKLCGPGTVYLCRHTDGGYDVVQSTGYTVTMTRTVEQIARVRINDATDPDHAREIAENLPDWEIDGWVIANNELDNGWQVTDVEQTDRDY